MSTPVDGDNAQADSAVSASVAEPPPPPPPADKTKVSDSRLAARPGEDLSVDAVGGSPPTEGPASSGATAPVLTIEDAIRQEVYARRIAGGIIGGVGVVVVAAVIIIAAIQLNKLIPTPIPTGKEYLLIISMAAHVGISVAAVWFGYQMLRAAERMFVPRRFLTDARDVEVLQALIGIRAPTTALADQAKALAEAATPIVKSIGEAVASALNKDKQ